MTLRRTRGIAPALIVIVGLGLPSPAVTAPRQRAAARRVLAMAVRAVGGEAALRELRTFSARSSGRRWILDEGAAPGGAARPSATFDLRLRYALGRGRPRDRMRLDFVRTSSGGERPVREVISRSSGYISGVDANFSAPATKAMTSDRWAAIRAEQHLLNPHVLLRKALKRPRVASAGGTRRIGGRTFRVLVIKDRVAPIKLLIDTATGRIARLRTLQHDYLRRDVRVEVRYRRWRAAGDALRFPTRLRLSVDGEMVLRERRSSVTANRTFARRVFRFPAGVEAPFERVLARRGAKTSEWLVSFANLGFIKDGRQSTVSPLRVAPGVFLIQGSVNNSMVVRRDAGALVVEGALHELRTRAVVSWIRERFPDQRITHIVNTHHHSDHSGGMRGYVAGGARAVVHEAAADFFAEVFAERDSTVLPDELDRRSRLARIRSVPADGFTRLNDDLRPVEVYPIQNDHSVDGVIVLYR
ncbi:MAG: MBL fold metallo-hydrolase, partial [Actinomycetota bacterium]